MTDVQQTESKNPDWVDPSEYPFAPRYFDTDSGRLHYIDEGQGETLVFVHGTPTWSFLYRRQIKALSKRFRCIAPDHLGFGLSDKPADALYRPEDHARRLEQLIEGLGLRNITLVVHDFGGPIGLSYTLAHPANVRHLVLFNTWLWSVAGNGQARMVDRVVRGPLGDFLYRRLNASPRFLLPQGFHERKSLSAAIHGQYLQPFPTPQSRGAMLALARALVGSSAWYDSLWDRRAAIQDIPALLLWGMKDITFSRADLARWQSLFTRSETVAFPDAGHFVQEEADANTVNQHLGTFLSGTPA